MDSIKDRLYNVDFENKVMRGANVEAVRDIVGPQVFDDFFQTDVVLPKPMDLEVAVQLLSPSESVKYCARLDEPYYPKAFSKLMLKSTVDTLCDLYKSRRYGFDILSSAFGNLADHIHEAKQVAEDLSYDVGAPKHFDDCIQYLKEQTECFAGCFEAGLLSSDDSGKLIAYLTEALSPIKSFRLSEKYTDSSLLFDNLDHGTMGAPHFSGYEISFDDRYYDFDRQAAKDMREFCDYESKESETTVSRKMLHVPDALEDDKDLEF